MAENNTGALGTDAGGIIQEMLGKILPGGLGALLVPLLGKMIGDSNPALKSLLGLPLTSNMSAAGTAMAMQQREFNTIISNTTRDYDRAMELEFHKDVARQAKSFEAWSKETSSNSKEDYETYISATAKGSMRNPVSLESLGYKFLDPYDVKKATGYMGVMMNNMSGLAMKTGDREMVAASHAFTEDLFKNYDSKEHGGMTLAESAGVAAALTKTKNPLEGIDLGDSDKLKEAVKTFQGKVKDYAEALSPLKDVFGTDIGKMLGTLEALSGRTLANMTKDEVRNIINMVNESMLVDGATMPQISAITSTYQQAMAQMGVSDMQQAQAVSMGIEAISASSGLMPRYMSKGAFSNAVSRQTLSARTSKGADMLDKAFALWASKNGKSVDDKNIDATKAEFQKLVMGTNGEVSVSLALQAAGVNSTVGLEVGMGVGGGQYYEAAKRNNVGGSTAKASNAAREKARAGRRLKSLTGRTFSDKNIDATLDMLDGEGAVMLEMTKDEREEYMRKQGIAEDDIKQRLDVMGQIDAQENLKSYKVHMAAKYQEQKAARDKKIIRERTERVNKVAKNLKTGELSATLKQAVMSIGKNGVTASNILDQVAVTEKLRIALDDDEEMTTIGKAALADLADQDPNALKDEKKVNNAVLKALNYDRTAEAQTNRNYTAARSRLMKAKTADERKRAFEDMTIASMTSDESQAAYYKDTEEIEDETERKKVREQKRKVLLETAKTGGKEAVTQKIKESIFNDVVGKDTQVKTAYESWLKKENKTAGVETLKEFGESKEAKEAGLGENVKGLTDQVQDRLGDMRETKGASASDPLGGLAELIKPIAEWCKAQMGKNNDTQISLWDIITRAGK